MTPEKYLSPDPGGVGRGNDPGGVKPGITPFNPDPGKTLVIWLLLHKIFVTDIWSKKEKHDNIFVLHSETF